MTLLTPPANVDIVEVAPRDGFQSISDPLPTIDKQRCISALVDAGITRLEIGSFVSPKAIPQMADTGKLIAAFADQPALRLSALVPNLKEPSWLWSTVSARSSMWSRSQSHITAAMYDEASMSLWRI